MYLLGWAVGLGGQEAKGILSSKTTGASFGVKVGEGRRMKFRELRAKANTAQSNAKSGFSPRWAHG